VRVRVECYAGYTGDEEPRAFHMGVERHRVTAIVERWRDQDADYFRVRADDGNRYRLRHDRQSDAWELTVERRADA